MTESAPRRITGPPYLASLGVLGQGILLSAARRCSTMRSAAKVIWDSPLALEKTIVSRFKTLAGLEPSPTNPQRISSLKNFLIRPGTVPEAAVGERPASGAA